MTLAQAIKETVKFTKEHRDQNCVIFRLKGTGIKRWHVLAADEYFHMRNAAESGWDQDRIQCADFFCYDIWQANEEDIRWYYKDFIKEPEAQRFKK